MSTPASLPLAYEPRVSLSTGRVVGFEVSAPVALAQRLAAALEQLQRWENEGHHGLQLAFSVQGDDRLDEALLREIAGLCEPFGLVPGQIELGLNAAALPATPDARWRTCSRLRALGVSIAVARLDVSRLSLESAQRLPLDCVHVEPDPTHAVGAEDVRAVSRLAVGLARVLGLRMVARGLESAEQQAYFAQLKCEQGQGPLFGPPLDAAAAGALLLDEPLFVGGGVARPPRHLLLVDDEVNVLRSLQRALRAAHCTVHAVNSPEEGFAVLERFPIGVVVCDQRMPAMSGTEFLCRARQRHPQVVRIVLSGYTELQAVTQAVNDGAIYKFLTKPWNDAELLDEVAAAFRLHEQTRETEAALRRLQDSNRALAARLQMDTQSIQHKIAALDTTQRVLDAIPLPVIGVDARGLVALSNPAADRQVGGGQCLLGQAFLEWLPEAMLQGAPTTVSVAGRRFQVHRAALAGVGREETMVFTLVPEAHP